MTHIPSLHIPHLILLLAVASYLYLLVPRLKRFRAYPFRASLFWAQPFQFRAKPCKALWELFQQMAPSWTRRFQLTEPDSKVVTLWQLSPYHRQSFYRFASRILRLLCCVFSAIKLAQHTQHGSTCMFTGEEEELDGISCISWLPTYHLHILHASTCSPCPYYCLNMPKSIPCKYFIAFESVLTEVSSQMRLRKHLTEAFSQHTVDSWNGTRIDTRTDWKHLRNIQCI